MSYPFVSSLKQTPLQGVSQGPVLARHGADGPLPLGAMPNVQVSGVQENTKVQQAKSYAVEGRWGKEDE